MNSIPAMKYVDLQFLMSSTKNDVEQVKEFVKDVLELNHVSMGSLSAYFAENNFVEMKATAHMLKSSADIFDSALYKSKLVELEAKCKEENKELIGKALEEVLHVASRWEQQLREELEKL